MTNVIKIEDKILEKGAPLLLKLIQLLSSVTVKKLKIKIEIIYLSKILLK